MNVLKETVLFQSNFHFVSLDYIIEETCKATSRKGSLQSGKGSWSWWHIRIIPALRRLAAKLEASLGYTARLSTPPYYPLVKLQSNALKELIHPNLGMLAGNRTYSGGLDQRNSSSRLAWAS